MKTITMITVAGSLAFAAAPALAAPTAPATPNASQQCKALQTGMGKTAFGDLHGTNANDSNAFGKCVSSRSSKTAAAAKVAKTNAAKDCKAMPPAVLAGYGTGKNGANAYGKCVSTLAKTKTTATVKAQVKDDINAAKTCKALRKAAAAEGSDAFKAKNAFGKCVVREAKKAADARQA